MRANAHEEDSLRPDDEDPVGTTSKAGIPTTRHGSGELEKQLHSPERVTMLSDGVRLARSVVFDEPTEEFRHVPVRFVRHRR